MPIIDLLDQLPKVPEATLRAQIRNEISDRGLSIIVLDDDPTGTQTVYDIPVLTGWSVPEISEEFERGVPLFYILTNSRSLPATQAVELAREIGRNIVAASQRRRRLVWVISRSDSTLRGHYPHEVEALSDELSLRDAIRFIIPAFFEGGRYTIYNMHYVREGDQLIPAAETPFARDKVFGYRNSDLKDWVEEKTGGKTAASAVFSFSIEELRTQALEQLAEKIRQLPEGSTCIVNAAAYYDLEAFCLALLQSGRQPLFRTAASLVAALAAQPPRALLNKQDLIEPNAKGALLVAGSYVPKTTQQLQYLFAHSNVHAIEIDVSQLLADRLDAERISRRCSQLMGRGQDVAIYTSRELVAVQSERENLAIGHRVSAFLCDIVRGLTVRPAYILAKGGITSSDIATESLGVKRAMIRGQILPGVPVWQLGVETPFPGLPYIVFPGNVGGETAILDVVEKLKE
jgi:uncharacterized protein YgbK (DUF1537 family)